MTKRPLILTFCNRSYLPILANFLAAPGAPSPENLRVYGLDAEAVAFAKAAGAEAVEMPWDGDFASLWAARIGIFKDLLSDGHCIVHTDADAIWLKDPLSEWLLDDADMSFTQGTIHPPEVFERWGFVLCCGLFCLNATAASQGFLSRVADDIEETGDDQTSVNRVLLADRMEWAAGDAPDYKLRMRGLRFSCWKSALHGLAEGGDLSARLVPHRIVQRIQDPIDLDGDVHVSHPLSPKSAPKKLELFEKMGLRFIREDWQSVPNDAPYEAYLASGT